MIGRHADVLEGKRTSAGSADTQFVFHLSDRESRRIAVDDEARDAFVPILRLSVCHN